MPPQDGTAPRWPPRDPTAGYGGRIKKLIANLTLWLGRYRLVQGPPSDPAFVLVAAPHTSNWDFPLMLAMAWKSGVKVRWLGKEAMFKGVFGPLMRALGGIPVDRENPAGLVENMAKQFGSGESFALVVPAEGTRGKGEYWKSGFRRIADAAGVPIVLSYLDGPSRTGGFGLVVQPTDDVVADMDRVREFYADKRGVKPENRTEPRLREEVTDQSS
jgi:1-acyl-sn-glycerol-3-phosphate acyltransferase